MYCICLVISKQTRSLGDLQSRSGGWRIHLQVHSAKFPGLGVGRHSTPFRFNRGKQYFALQEAWPKLSNIEMSAWIDWTSDVFQGPLQLNKWTFRAHVEQQQQQQQLAAGCPRLHPSTAGPFVEPWKRVLTLSRWSSAEHFGGGKIMFVDLPWLFGWWEWHLWLKSPLWLDHWRFEEAPSAPNRFEFCLHQHRGLVCLGPWLWGWSGNGIRFDLLPWPEPCNEGSQTRTMWHIGLGILV